MLNVKKQKTLIWISSVILCPFLIVYLSMTAIKFEQGLLFVLYTLILYITTVIILIRTDFNFIHIAVLFCGMYLLSIGIGPYILLPFNSWYSYNLLFIIAGGYLAFASGYCIGFPSQVGKNRVKFKFHTKKIRRKKILLFLILISTIVYFVYISRNVGIIFTQNFEDSRVTSQTGNGIFLYIIRMWTLTIPMLYEELKFEKATPKWFYFLMIFCTVALIPLGSRTGALIIILEVSICKIIIEKIETKVIVKYVVLLIIIAAFLGLVRAQISGIHDQSLNSMFMRIIRGQVYNLSYILRCFPTKIPFQLGSTYFINIKMLLPGPDLDFTLWLKNVMNMSFSGGGVTPTILGEWYINWGYNGIFIGMFLWGIMSKRLNIYLQKSPIKSFAIYCTIYFVFTVNGGIATSILPILINGLVYCFINVLSKPQVTNKEGDLN